MFAAWTADSQANARVFVPVQFFCETTHGDSLLASAARLLFC